MSKRICKYSDTFGTVFAKIAWVTRTWKTLKFVIWVDWSILLSCAYSSCCLQIRRADGVWIVIVYSRTHLRKLEDRKEKVLHAHIGGWVRTLSGVKAGRPISNRGQATVTSQSSVCTENFMVLVSPNFRCSSCNGEKSATLNHSLWLYAQLFHNRSTVKVFVGLIQKKQLV